MSPLERWFLGKLRGSTFQHLPPHARILEVGAGTGLNFVYYPANSLGVATEPSREMLRIAANKKRPPGLSILQSCAEELPFEAGSFDAALATLVFCSVQSPAQALAELRRVVKPGGTIVLLDHVRPGGLLGPIFDLLNLITVPLFDDHFNRRTVDEARAAGLQLMKVEKHLLGIINLVVCRTDAV
jgi:ubiquinone/menaquinone biosynthesis C-methylase UbiE